jgi:hypothetical protein
LRHGDSRTCGERAAASAGGHRLGASPFQPSAPVDPMDAFKADPLIRKAIEILKAEISAT